MAAKRQDWVLLFLISTLSLFFELAIIRWVSAEVRILAYFKNLSLLAAFLGLGVGFALVGKGRDYRLAFAPLFGLFVMLVVVVGGFTSSRGLIYPGGGDEALWNVASFSYGVALVLFLGTVLIFFLVTMFLFIPLGQATGEEMARHAPLPAYITNIVASLAGVWIFALFSYLQTPPVIWFGAGLLGLGYYLAIRRALSRLNVAIWAVTLLGLGFYGRGVIWSPYQRLDVTDKFLPRQSDGTSVKVGYTLNVQQVFHQSAVNLSPAFLDSLGGDIPEMDEMSFAYNMPYRLGPPGGKVLIVGAGMGNDVAAVLRNQARHVDAVEIDPAILEQGRALHPEQPYADSRVSVVVDDARAFFKESTERYDVIAFGLLDSHTLLSGLSSVRLDSFVYTLESFEQVRAHLNENGLVAVTFATTDNAPWIEERLGRTLVEVFGPDRVFVHTWPHTVAFVAGPVPPDRLAEAQLTAWRPGAAELPLATDDWPYLYLRARMVPPVYWQTLLLIGVITLALIARSFPAAMRPNWHFWLLGAAFLLIEFKSITELALLFGTTWFVNALAISGVLLMALAANVVVLWRMRLNLGLTYVFLFVSLGLTYFLPLDVLNVLSPLLRSLVSMVLLSLPLFFAGLIFSESLRQAGETSGPLASNLSGSVAGGALEYASLWWGIKSLYLLAAVVYAGAVLAWKLQRK